MYYISLKAHFPSAKSSYSLVYSLFSLLTTNKSSIRRVNVYFVNVWGIGLLATFLSYKADPLRTKTSWKWTELTLPGNVFGVVPKCLARLLTVSLPPGVIQWVLSLPFCCQVGDVLSFSAGVYNTHSKTTHTIPRAARARGSSRTTRPHSSESSSEILWCLHVWRGQIGIVEEAHFNPERLKTVINYI